MIEDYLWVLLPMVLVCAIVGWLLWEMAGLIMGDD